MHYYRASAAGSWDRSLVDVDQQILSPRKTPGRGVGDCNFEEFPARLTVYKFGSACRVAKAAGLSIASVGLALSANAATVKLGADGGGLVFDPANLTVQAGDTVEWVNNVGFPHNVVFDEDEIPVRFCQPICIYLLCIKIVLGYLWNGCTLFMVWHRGLGHSNSDGKDDSQDCYGTHCKITCVDLVIFSFSLRRCLVQFSCCGLDSKTLWQILQEGASADALSHEDYLNAPGQKVTSKFTTPGKYSYCESPFTCSL